MSDQPLSTRAVEKKRDIRDLIQSERVKAQMAMVLPKHLTPDRMARVAITAIIKTPKLADCSPESLLQALMLCSQAGLEPDGRNAHLIPYGNVVQVIFDWKGLVALARRNGVENIAADIICENDTFEWFRNGEGLQFKHIVDYRKARGAMFAAYCIWKDSDQFDGEVMTKEEIDGIRKRSKASGSGPWVSDYNEMAKKTVVRRASKKWPLDAELAEAAMVDETTIVAPPARPSFDTAAGEALFPNSLPPAETDNPMGDPDPAQPEPAKAAMQEPVATKKKETAAPVHTVNYLKGLRGLLKVSTIDEAEFISFMVATSGWEETLTTLDDVSQMAPVMLASAYENWDKLNKQFTAAKAKQ